MLGNDSDRQPPKAYIRLFQEANYHITLISEINSLWKLTFPQIRSNIKNAGENRIAGKITCRTTIKRNGSNRKMQQNGGAT